VAQAEAKRRILKVASAIMTIFFSDHRDRGVAMPPASCNFFIWLPTALFT